MSFATLIAVAFLVLRVLRHGPLLALHEQFFVDSFNVFLVALTAFVGFTTALFSRPYMRIEEQRGRLTPQRLRLYHSMYQLFMAAMFLALLTNNMGLLWVAMEAATLSTVLLVSLYRTRASLEAAWKYFILCGVGIAQALFGTILLYFAAEHVAGPPRHDGIVVDAPQCSEGATRTPSAGTGLCLPIGWLWDESRPGPAPQLAA